MDLQKMITMYAPTLSWLFQFNKSSKIASKN